VVLGLELRVSCLLDFARQVLYHLNHSVSPIFVMGFSRSDLKHSLPQAGFEPQSS
jgi:hypothetical protein